MLEYCSIETRRGTAPDHPPKRITEPAILTTGRQGRTSSPAEWSGSNALCGVATLATCARVSARQDPLPGCGQGAASGFLAWWGEVNFATDHRSTSYFPLSLLGSRRQQTVQAHIHRSFGVVVGPSTGQDQADPGACNLFSAESFRGLR